MVTSKPKRISVAAGLVHIMYLLKVIKLTLRQSQRRTHFDDLAMFKILAKFGNSPHDFHDAISLLPSSLARRRQKNWTKKTCVADYLLRRQKQLVGCVGKASKNKWDITFSDCRFWVSRYARYKLHKDDCLNNPDGRLQQHKTP